MYLSRFEHLPRISYHGERDNITPLPEVVERANIVVTDVWRFGVDGVGVCGVVEGVDGVPYLGFRSGGDMAYVAVSCLEKYDVAKEIVK